MSARPVLVRLPEGDELLAPTCLLIAIDETGHEELADPGYPVFGLGGCLTTVAEYHDQIRAPWATLKHRYFQGPSVALHATGLKLSTEQAAAVGAFFREQTFGRFAAVTTVETSLRSPMSRYEATGLMMGRLIAEAATEYEFDRIAVLFEHSDRTEALIRRTFSPTKTYSGEAAKRWQVPTKFFFTTKDTAEPLAEVADFIMQASGSAVRTQLVSGTPFLKRRDFAAVFEGGLERRAAFFRVDEFSLPKGPNDFEA
jgi:hypothetical protein